MDKYVFFGRKEDVFKMVMGQSPITIIDNAVIVLGERIEPR